MDEGEVVAELVVDEDEISATKEHAVQVVVVVCVQAGGRAAAADPQLRLLQASRNRAAPQTLGHLQEQIARVEKNFQQTEGKGVCP